MKFSIPRHTDQVIYDAFLELAEAMSTDSYTVKATMLGSERTVVIGEMNSKEADQLEDVLMGPSIFTSRLTLSTHKQHSSSNFNVSVTLFRGGSLPETPDPVWDEIIVSRTDPNSALNHLFKEFEKGFAKLYEKLSLKVTNIPSSEIGLQDLNALHLSTIERFEETAVSAVNKVTEHGVSLADEYRTKREELEQEFKAREKELERNFLHKKDLLSVERSKFDSEKKSFDDLKNTFERRGIHQRLLSEIKNRQENFYLTQRTNRKRIPVTILLFLLMSGLGWFSYEYGQELAQSLKIYTIELGVDGATDMAGGIGRSVPTSFIIYLALRQLLMTVAFLGTALFSIRWMTQWADRHAQAEFRNKEFELDMERAGWLVEATLEWNEKKDGEIPEKLLESLSRGLFEGQRGQVESVQHPADQLASALMGAASSVDLKLGSGGSSVAINPKKLARQKIGEVKSSEA